ncbi:MAG TPA: hypothetical protein VK363_11970 [Pyrinomonadaceae bacterium]|nr:hypothetical protein [Pyrinomonadaceae bacterium]
MNMKKNSSVKKALGMMVLVAVAMTTGVALKHAAALTGKSLTGQQADISKSDLPRNKSVYKLNKLNRKVKLNMAGDSVPSVALHLNGLQPTDYVNIRPTDKSEIEVTAGILELKSDDAAKEEKRLPESSLEVTADAVNFARPSTTVGVVVIDVGLPSGSQTSAFVDGEMVLQANLQEAASIKGRAVGRGTQNMADALIRAVMPAALQGKSANKDAIKLEYSDKYFVPFAKLQVLRKVAVDLSSPQTRAGIEINKEGKVVKVTPFNQDSAAGLEKALKQWEFAPYLVDGQPVAVTTVISLLAINQ